MAKKFGGDLIHDLVTQGANQNATIQQSSNTTSSNTTDSITTKRNVKVQIDNKMRTSYIINKDINLKLKYIALKEGCTISELVEDALWKMISSWEKKNGQTPNL